MPTVAEILEQQARAGRIGSDSSGRPGPTWTLVNLDNPLSIPVIGQFPPNLEEDDGAPIWQNKPGIAGSQPWLKYIGKNISSITFDFHFIAGHILDQVPVVMWNRLKDLSNTDDTLNRPPRVMFSHGIFMAEGFLTEVPPGTIKYWEGGLINSRIVREIGPVRVKLTRIPVTPAELSTETNFAPRTTNTTYEDLSKLQYGNARYAQSLAEYNQGVQVGEKIEMPRSSRAEISIVTTISEFLDNDLVPRSSSTIRPPPRGVASTASGGGSR